MAANVALGAMQTALRATTEYLKSRKQFGVTLNTFQALTFRAADMYVSQELTHQHRRLGHHGRRRGRRRRAPRPCTTPPRAPALQVSRAGRHIGQEAIQLHGGIGMTAEYSVGAYFATLTALDHLFGDATHQLGDPRRRRHDVRRHRPAGPGGLNHLVEAPRTSAGRPYDEPVHDPVIAADGPAAPSARPVTTPAHRARAVALYLGAAALWVAVVGVPNDPIGVFLWLWAAGMAWNIDAPREYHLRFPRDWWPVLLGLVIYWFTRGLADEVGLPVHVTMPIRVDEALGRG